MKKGFFLVLILVSFLAAGCIKEIESVDTSVVTHTVLICGSRSNTCYTTFLHTQEVKDFILESTRSYGTVTLIVADGDPYVAEKYTITPSEKKLAKKKKKQIAAQQAEQILNTANVVEAASEEVDMLAALRLAGRSLSGMDGEKQILVIDSGLSTSGKVNCLQTDLLEQGLTEEHFLFLQKEKELPVLDGVTVRWMGLGDTAGQQPPCSPIVRDTLMQIWKMVLHEAEAVTFSSEVPGDEQQRDLPFVSVVEYPEEKVFSPVVLDDEKLMFQPDSVELVDRNQAEVVLLPLVNELKASKIQIGVFGTTASVGKNSDCVAFSEARAEVVKDLLVNDMGLPEEQIGVTKGLGYESMFYTNDRLPDGTLDPVAAKKNRSVIIMSMSDVYKNDLV